MKASIRTRIVAVIAAAAVLVTTAAGSAVAAPILPPPAPEDVTAVATLTKTASLDSVAPGDTFTYTLTVGCSSITDLGCRDAVLTDVVPAPFVLVDAVVGAGVNTADEPVISGNSVTVAWTTDLDGSAGDAVGILDATTGIVEITVTLPADTSYDASGIPVTNEAYLEGTNFVDVPASVEVTPVIELDLATAAGKTLTPPATVGIPGLAVTAALTGSNDSNATVDTLVIQDPQEDPPGTPNPFEYLGFTGFGTVTAPAGTTSTTYEVYVPDAWIEAPGGVLPAGVDPASVRGTRVTFAGAIPVGATASVDLDLALTELGAEQPDGTIITNTVASTVALGDDSTSDTAADDFTILANDIVVEAGKSFDPPVVVAGEPADVALEARNASSITLEQLTIREPSSGTFPDAYVFDGFASGIPYPANATTAYVVYHTASGDQTVPFANNGTPADPTGDPADVEWFEVVFEGPILPGAETEVVFTVDTDPDLTGLPLTVPNEVAVEGSNQGATNSTTASDDLYIYSEVIDPYVRKTIRPSEILAVPGEVVTVSLEGGLTNRPNPPEMPTGSTGNAQEIVIQDPQDPVEGDAWWNAFDLTGIAQTPVPAGSSLTIEYYDTTDGQWKVLTADIAGPTIYSAGVPDAISDVAGGIRFTYTYTDPDGLGFPPGTNLAPNFTSTLRPDGRYTPGPPFSDDSETLVPNCAQSSATSVTPTVPDGAAQTPAPCPEITLIPTDPGDADMISKEFGTSSSGGIKSVIARSGDTIPSTLFWSTSGYSGFETVEITDTANAETLPIAQSVYDAFDVTRIDPIDPTTDPHIIYDQVDEVLLWNGSGWVAAANDPCPAACVGTFPGMDLTVGERATTTGVRLVFSESPDRAAVSQGNLDAPPVGSGVARSFGNDRQITLVWQVRDERRSDGSPVLGDVVFNLPDPGVVRNTARAEGFPQGGGPSISSEDSDDVVIVDVPITTTTNKVWSGGPLAVPTDALIPASQYPISRVSVTTRNTTPARVDQLQITDPAPGSTGNRRTDMFAAFTLFRFASISVPSGATSAVVRLSCPAPAAPVEYSVAQALALQPADLPCDPTGIQVEFDGRIASNASGVVTLDVRLRPFWRGTLERVSPADSPIANTAQGIVADIDAIGVCPPAEGSRFACDDATAFIQLQEPSFSVTAGKSFSPTEQKPGDDSPITMTLTGQPGGSARMITMTITDDDPAFWNAMDFAGMSPLWTLPAPVGVVQACYLNGGAFTPANVEAGTVGGTWTCQPAFGTVADASSFLLSAPDDLHGLRFSFQQANGLGWSNPANPVVRVPVLLERRDDLRSGGPVPTTRADEVPAPGQADAGSFWNTTVVDGVSSNVGTGALTATDDADAEYRYLHLEAAVSVAKTPTGDVRPGQVIPFTLAFSNVGEAPLSNPVFSDRLPTDADGAMLVFDPDADPSTSPYAFALAGAAPVPPNGLALPTDVDDITIVETANEIRFEMPPGSVLEPGQTYTITIQLMLRPGLPAGTDVRNWAVMTEDEPLDECVPTFEAETGACLDDSIVRPLAVPAISTVKRVKSAVEHGQPGIPEVFSSVDGYDCADMIAPDRFYRYPCTPVTLPGGDEIWKFTIINAGTLPLDTVVSIDNLPTPGDQGLIVQLPRGSEWEPAFQGGVQLVPTGTTPPGAVLATYYSTASVPCTADLNPLGTQCAPGAWLPLTPDVDPEIVRSLKFVVDFPDADPLQPAETLDIQFRTRTSPDQALSTDFPTAFNTVSTGGSALDPQGARVLVPATEGRRVGISYPTGPIQLQKEVTGPAAGLAPDSFPVQLVCESAGVPVTGLPEVVLVPGADPTTIEGLPWGAVCTATEGEWGQTSEIIGTATVGGPEDEIGLISVENVFDVADLTIRKTVVSDATDASGEPISYGPFGFDVSCTFLGQEVWAEGYGPDSPMQAELTPEETWALTGLPVGAECEVVETDVLGALGTTIIVTGPEGPAEPVSGTSVTVEILEGTDVQVDVVNEFGTGSLDLEKIVTGEAAEDFGQGPFELEVTCTLDTGDGVVDVWDGTVTLGGEAPLETTIDDIAAAAECTVTETDSAGATDVEIEGSPAIVGNDQTVTVTVTNTFDAGSIDVVKVRDGEGAELWGAGPFEVTLSCVDEEGAEVEIPGGAVRILDAENDYSTTYAPLLIGLECTVTETGTGGATTTAVTSTETGEPVDVIEVTDETAGVTVTNTFDVGGFAVVKTVSGGAASQHRGDVFQVTATCTWQGASIEVPGGAGRDLRVGTAVEYTDLPVGAECTVRETNTGGAAVVTYTPGTSSGSAVVVIGEDAAASVAIDNRFDPPLPATGGEALGWIALGVVAVILVGGGAVLMIVRRRQDDRD